MAPEEAGGTADDRGPRTERKAAPGKGGDGAPPQAGVIGIGLAAVLTFSLADGAWEWFATYIGVTLLAVVFSFNRLPRSKPGLRSSYMSTLSAFSMVVGLCVAIALAPALQRSAWLFPMPGTRDGCRHQGAYERLRTEASLAGLAGRDKAALAYAQDAQGQNAVADCLAHVTTLWLPVYGLGASVLVGLGAWFFDRARARREAAAAARSPHRS
ncbi:hypothetical protein [Streptomyces sp. B1I3]|uniref:hypothetical protein n=1 Tax=Streptomyces sp. B1I3 TaxID=3042264 RepID=UPI00278054B7|nr:hypothetical protein [Streptomyces sp. B1I3]MDQ0793087.1 hypothetical protein [Streptomyces sp. B1I3]